MSKLLEILSDPRNQPLLRRQMRAHFEASLRPSTDLNKVHTGGEALEEVAAPLESGQPDQRLSILRTFAGLGPVTTPEILAKLVVLFRDDAPKIWERFRIMADSWIGMPSTADAHAEPQHIMPRAVPEIGWMASGDLAEGRLTYEIDRNRDSGAVEFRFGSRNLGLEHAIITVDGVAAPGGHDRRDRESTRTASPYRWLTLLEKYGSDQVGGDIYIPRSDLPAESPFGIAWRVRLVELV